MLKRLSTIFSVVALTWLPTVAWAAGGGADQIHLLGRSLTPRSAEVEAARGGLEQAAARLAAEGVETIHVLVQLDAIPGEAEKNELWREGLDLGAYVPQKAWIAAVPVARLATVAARQDVLYLAHWDAESKVHPRLAAGDVASWARDPSRPGWLMTFVLLHHDVELERGYELAEAVGGIAMPPLDGLHGLTVWLPAGGVSKLAEREEVLWIEEGPPPLSPTNDDQQAQMNVPPLLNPPYSLDGSGVRVFVYDGGRVRATHQTFNPGTGSRVTYLDTTALSNHSTHVAGTMGGDGSGSPGSRGRGIAVDTSILSAGYQQFAGTMLFWDNAGDIQADYSLARNTHDADLGTNSIGSNVALNGYPCSREGDYGVSSALLDGIVRGTNPTVGSAVLLTWANGNERAGGSPPGRCGGGYATTPPPACAKNAIHVGALNSDGGSMTSFSSWGPCDDGRLKPVVSAPGCETGRVSGETAIYSSMCANPPPSGACTSDNNYGLYCGTSMATPAVAGTAALFIEDWRALGYGGANDRPLPALVKAMLVETARDLGQDGPDYIHGYGAVDAQELIDLLRAGTGTPGGNLDDWGTGSISQGSVDSFNLAVPAGSGELEVTLAWDDAPAAAFAGFAPVNDLDLELIAPDSTVHRPWVLSPASPHLPATTGVNSLDNQEQVRVVNPLSGTWTVRVVGTAVPQGPQSYGLAHQVAPIAHQASACVTSSWGFETGNDGWTLSGATRVAAPAAGHGSWSLRFGGAVNTTHEATLDVAVPNWSGRANWTFFWYMTTLESQATGWSWDHFLAEVRDPATSSTLAVYDLRYDGWQQGQWMQQEHIDLTPYMGQTVRLVFRGRNNSVRPTIFWVDDGALESCRLLLTDAWSKDLPGDTGIEPDPLPGPMWTSPDIWVRNDLTPGPHQNPEFGQTNYVHVMVRNRSTVEAVNVPVLLYTANASAGLAWPVDWTFVGSQVIPSLAPGADTEVVIPWDPPGTGHYCLLSRLVTDQDPMFAVETTDVNYNTRQNNNIVWKNVNIVDLVAQESQEVELIVRNPAAADLEIDLVFSDRTRGGLFLDRGRVLVVLDEALSDLWAPLGHPGQGIEAIDDRTFEVVAQDAFITVPLAPGEGYPVTVLFLDTGGGAGSNKTTLYTFDVVERESGQNKGDPLGGVTYEITAAFP